jgi:hypothetical protein
MRAELCLLLVGCAATAPERRAAPPPPQCSVDARFLSPRRRWPAPNFHPAEEHRVDRRNDGAGRALQMIVDARCTFSFLYGDVELPWQREGVVRWTRDAEGRIVEIELDGVRHFVARRDDAGRLLGWSEGSRPIGCERDYDAAGRVAACGNLRFDRDAKGRLVSAIWSGASGMTWTWGPDGRLATYCDNGNCQSPPYAGCPTAEQLAPPGEELLIDDLPLPEPARGQ